MELTELNLSEEQLTGVQDYIKEELAKGVQSEGDKIRTKYSKITKDYEEQIKGLNDTIADLKGKLPIEKSEAEIELDKRLKALEDREKELNRKEKYNNITNALTDKGLNGELAKYLNIEGINEGEDLETYLSGLVEVIGKTKNTFKPKNHVTQNNNITKDDFKKMNTMQRMKLYKENKELYDILSE